MRAADESEFDWNDDVLLDPYQSSLSQGRHEGLGAGMQSGFLEGQALGLLKGIEIGVELGYMHAFATMALDHVQQGLMQHLSESSKK
jgi:flagellar biosynthesis/type III secretory pathway protein FliH